MNEISQPLAPATTPGPTEPTRTPSATQSIGAEFDTFLRLLTAQIRNQDPLAPMDSTQFVEQLATFSTLEQQVQTNTILESMAASLTSLHSTTSADWVGRTVAVPSSVIRFDGSDVDFTFDAPDEADTALLAVRSSDGQLLGRTRLNPTTDIQTWNGRLDGSRTPLPDGQYFVEVELLADGLALGSVTPRIIGNVSQVQVIDGEALLVTDQGLAAPISAVEQVK